MTTAEKISRINTLSAKIRLLQDVKDEVEINAPNSILQITARGSGTELSNVKLINYPESMRQQIILLYESFAHNVIVLIDHHIKTHNDELSTIVPNDTASNQ